MTRINEAINRRIALVQLTAATMLAAGAAKAQRPDPSLTQIKTTDLGRKTYMLEGQGGNVLMVIGDDGIIMVDAELAPLHDKIKAAITDNSNLPIKYLVDTHFHGEQTGGNAPFHRDGAIIVVQDDVRVRLLAAPQAASTTERALRRTRPWSVSVTPVMWRDLPGAWCLGSTRCQWIIGSSAPLMMTGVNE